MKQQTALDILKMGHNVFLTGPAGSGKTYLLNQYIDYLKKKNIRAAVTASTGIAATHMNGITIHSWSGIQIKDVLTDADFKKLSNKQFFKQKLKSTKVLIIDEISMLHAHQLDMVNSVCKRFKNPLLPFGGLQVILCGDFFQLPPVAKYGQKGRFVTESFAWSEMNPRVCYLEEQHRQEDQQMLKVLNDIRSSTHDDRTLGIILTRQNQPIKNSIKPTKLFTHNLSVDAINDFELQKIKEDPVVFKMTSGGLEDLIKTLKGGCLAPENLILKKGAVVMFVKNNFDRGYVNGTLGKVMGFDEEGFPIVKTYQGQTIHAQPEGWSIDGHDDKPLAWIMQVPLRLAWAITVHKSQGMTLDAAEIDLSKSFEYGMGYVALSRVRRLDGIKLLGINEAAMEVNPEVTEMDKVLLEMSHGNVHEISKMGWLEKRTRHKEFLNRCKE